MKYSIGLSYESNSGPYVRNVAKALATRLGKEKVFFDRFWPNEVVGKNKISQIFSEECEFVVPFFSEKYSQSPHCMNEWKVILPRLEKKQGIPVKLDGVIANGWTNTDVVVTRGRKTGKILADDILRIYYDYTANTSGQNSHLIYGLVISADISDFSSLPSDEYQKAIDILWITADKSGLLDDHYGPASSGILDGVVITLSKNARHESVLTQCEKWIAAFHSMTKNRGMNFNRGVGLRIAIHQGGFYEYTTRNTIMGKAPNECCRLVRMAPEGGIVVSRDFVNAWKSEGGELKHLTPADTSMAFWTKPGHVSYFRFYKNDSSAPLPEVLRKAQEWEYMLQTGIAAIEDEFAECVIEESHAEALEPEKLKTRVSLFRPVLDRKLDLELKPTKFRFTRQEDFPDTVNYGATSYLATPSRAEGPLGTAFIQKKVVVVKGLPDYKTSPNDYATALKSAWNIPEAKTHQFSKHARCIIAIPFWMHANCKEPEGVICIDTEHPLDDTSEEFLAECGEEFGVIYGPLFSALFQLRATLHGGL